MSEGVMPERAGGGAHARRHVPLSRDELRAAIHDELGRRRFWPDFAGHLESYYLRDVGQNWVRSDAQAVLLGVVLFDLWTVTDYLTASDIWAPALAYRLLFVTPLLLVAAWIDRASRGSLRRSLRQAYLFLIVSVPLLVLYGFSAVPTVALSYLIFPVALVFANLCLSMSLRHVVVVDAALTVAFTLAIMLSASIPANFGPTLVVAQVSLAAIGINAKYRMEHSQRRAWLLGTQDGLKAEVLSEIAEDLSTQSNTDPLTRVANRRMFESSLARLWHGERPIALLMLDVDNFKRFNDGYGHLAGDRCLCRIADAAESRLRTGIDVLARYGGEEFAVILPGCALEDAQFVADHIRRTIHDARIPHDGNADGHVTVSIGVAARIPATGAPPSELIAAADASLYVAKATGRNRVHPPLAGTATPVEEDEIIWRG